MNAPAPARMAGAFAFGLLAALAGPSVRAAAPASAVLPPAAGEVATLPMGEGLDAMKVFIPTNYTPDRAWPALLFYSPMGLPPTPALLRPFTGDRDFVIAGVPYVPGPGSGTLGPEEQRRRVQAEQAGMRRAIESLAAFVRVDRTRIILAGASKGGWTASILADAEMQNLAGLAIFLAGKQRTAVTPAPGIYRGKAVYIGVGEKDPNRVPALQARAVYAQLGASVTYEEYPGVGHEPPPSAPQFLRWAEAMGHFAHPWTGDAQRAKLREGFRETYRQTMAVTNLQERHRLLLDLVGDPRLRLCGDAVVRGVAAQLQAVRSVPPMREEWAAETEFARLAWLDWNLRTLADIKGVHDGLQNFAQRYPGTAFAAHAAAWYERVGPPYAKTIREATEAMEKAKAASGGKKGGVDVRFPKAGVDWGR